MTREGSSGEHDCRTISVIAGPNGAGKSTFVEIRSNPDNNSMSMDEKVAAACRDAGLQAIEVAERTGTSIVIWRDGKIVHLNAAEARVEFDRTKGPSSDTGTNGVRS